MDKMNRRSFLAKTGSAAAVAAPFMIVPRHVLGGGETPPSEKLNIAGIGIGGMGGANINNCKAENIVALCDVDFDYAAKMFKAYPNAVQYKDYRVMLEKQKDIDAVIIGTPDHTHAVIAAAAMRAGKHVYCQKPLTHDVFEARKLAEIARETGVVTQMGIQGHSMEGIRLICEWIGYGAIGAVREVDAWCSLTYYPWGHASWSSPLGQRPTDTPPIPDTLDWDIWLGPAPERPYHPTYHPRTWRSWLDFGSGMMGDRGVHTLDPVFSAMHLGHPTSIDATSTDLNPETHPIACIVRYEFPERTYTPQNGLQVQWAQDGKLPPLTLTWYDGMRPPRPNNIEDGRLIGNEEGGVIFKGEKASIMCGVYGESPRIFPEAAMKDFQRPPETIPRIEGTHEDDWVRACKADTKADADFAYSGPLTEMCQLGNVAKRVDTRIQWDGPNLKVTNNPEANQYIQTQYRKGWNL